MKLLLVMVMTTFALTGVAGAQEAQGVDITIDTVQDLAVLVGDAGTPSLAARDGFLSPDGERVAWFVEFVQLCVHTFADESTVCSPLPADFDAVPADPRWSPDGRFISFNQDVIRFAIDADLYRFAVETREVVNLTPDDADSVLPQRGMSVAFTVDYSAVWHPLTGDLYFFSGERLRVGGELDFSTQLMRVPSGSDEPERLADLTAVLPNFPVYNFENHSELRGAQAFSPDGTRLAMIVRGAPPEDERNGIWVVDLDSPDAPQQITGLPFDGLIAGGLDWLADGERLLVQSKALTSPSASNLYVVEVASGQVTPVFDANAERVALLLPGTNRVLLLSDASGAAPQITLIDLDADPQESDSFSFGEGTFVNHEGRMSSVSADGSRALIGGYLVTLAAP